MSKLGLTQREKTKRNKENRRRDCQQHDSNNSIYFYAYIKETVPLGPSFTLLFENMRFDKIMFWEVTTRFWKIQFNVWKNTKYDWTFGKICIKVLLLLKLALESHISKALKKKKKKINSWAVIWKLFFFSFKNVVITKKPKVNFFFVFSFKIVLFLREIQTSSY